MDSIGSQALLLRMASTFTLAASYLAMGLVDALRGPTLLDLADLAAVDVAHISYIFPAFSCGSIVSSLVCGACLDRWPRILLPLISVSLLLMSLSTALLPHFPGLLWPLCAASVAQGAALGVIDAGGAVLCLALWPDRRADPFLYAIHFAYSVGSLLAPVMAAPFLSQGGENQTYSEQHDKAEETSLEDGRQMEVLYGIVGGICMAAFLLFALFHAALASLKCCKRQEQQQSSSRSQTEEVVTSSSEEDQLMERSPSTNETSQADATFELPTRRARVAVFCLLCAFFFIYVGSEFSFGTFLTTFCVVGGLKLSRSQGAKVTSVYYASQTVAKGLAIFTSAILKSHHVLLLGLVLCSLGGAVSALLGQQSLPALEAASAMLGAGAAPLFAAGLLWAEGHYERPLGGRAVAAFSVAGSVGAELVPLTLGQLVEAWPLVLPVSAIVAVAGCSALILLAMLVARRSQMASS